MIEEMQQKLRQVGKKHAVQSHNQVWSLCYVFVVTQLTAHACITSKSWQSKAVEASLTATHPPTFIKHSLAAHQLLQGVCVDLHCRMRRTAG